MNDREAWGEPAFLFVPNGYHRPDAPAFERRYPSIKAYCPRGARAKAGAFVAVDGTHVCVRVDAS